MARKCFDLEAAIRTPLFPPKTQNIWEVLLTGANRTNNTCKSWNNSYSCLVGHAHQCVQTSVEAIRKDHASTSSDLYQYANGQPPHKWFWHERVWLENNLNEKSAWITSEAMQYRQAMSRIHTVSLRDYTIRPLKQNFNIIEILYRNVGLSRSKSRKNLNFW